MRQLILSLLLVLLLLTACANNNDVALPVPGSPGAETGSVQGQEPVQPTQPPVIQPTATPSLPPTFTPNPMAHQGHLYLLPVSGEDGRYIHVVQLGETLAGLSHLYGIPLADMAQANNIQNYDLIRVGANLIIPLTGD